MRFLTLALATASLVASTAFASPTEPKNGVEYTTLAEPQASQTVGKKVEVIEFFMYHCPHCNVLEPSLEEWVKKQGENIVFRRIHIPSTGPTDPEAHLFLTLEAMGRADLHAKVFHAVHVDRLRLNRDDVIIDWISKNGVDKAKFLEFYNSFGVLTKLKRQVQVVDSYKVGSAPTLIIDGRYVTSPATLEATNKGLPETQLQQVTLQTVDALIAKVQKEHAGKPAAKGAK